MSLWNSFKRFFKKEANIDDIYAEDPAYQEICREYANHCQKSGLQGEERSLLANVITASYYAYKGREKADSHFNKIQKNLEIIINIRMKKLLSLKMMLLPQCETLQVEHFSALNNLLVKELMSDARSLIRYWEEPYFEAGLPLLEKSLLKYFKGKNR